MAIRDRFRRALHKSPSSATLAPTESNNTITTTPTITTTATSKSEASSQQSSLRKEPTAHSAKFALPWAKSESEKAYRREEKEKKKKKQQQEQQEQLRRNKASSKPIHPRDKPLSPTNIRYQETLGDFDFSFGSSPNRLSQLIPEDSDLDFGYSPCCTRPASINGINMNADDEDDDDDDVPSPVDIESESR